MVNRRPNSHCKVCDKMTYKRPSQIRAGKEFCSRHCAMIWRHTCGDKPGRKTKPAPRFRENNPAWKGGRYVEPGKGYVLIRMPEHHRARVNGYVLEHIVVMERKIGRRLRPGERVHHVNHKRDDNRPENLELYANHRDHWVEHHMADCQAARDAAASRKRRKDLGPE